MNTLLKKVLPLLLMAVTSIQIQAAWDGTEATTFAGGEGTRENPYQIATAEQLAKFANDVTNIEGFSRGRYFKLTADIVMHENVIAKGISSLKGGDTFKQTPMVGLFTDEETYTAFEGVLDGDGHFISGLYTEEYALCISLFRVTKNATIKNLGIKDSYFYGNARFAALVGKMIDTKIINCYVKDCHLEGYGSYAGALVGQCVGTSEIINCYTNATLIAKNNAGGIVGRIGDGNTNECIVDNCLSLVTITTTKSNKAGISSENCIGAIVRNCIHQETLSTITSNKGTMENNLIVTTEDIAGTGVVTQLNARSEQLPGACRWTLNSPCPTLDYSIKTPSDEDPDYSAMATGPIPIDKDLHVNAEEGYVMLQWTLPIDGKTSGQHLYINTDIQNMANTDNAIKLGLDTSYKITLDKKNTIYYWRIDRIDTEGKITKGTTWSFMPSQLAFPGAEGYGRFAQGGRGGKVIYVTNLNARGEGSFHHAVTNGSGPRTVLFNVSGLIKLDNDLVCDDNITIAGQTAPGKGICIAGGSVGIANDNICRFIRSRRGGTADTGGSIGFYYADHAIIDHVTASWGTDETFSSRNCKNITFQRSIISEALGIAGHRKYPEGTNHGYAATIGGDIGSFHHNLLANCYGRNWSMGGGTDANGYYAGRLDIFNNVVYNWVTRTTDGGAHEVNFVNNYYKLGTDTELTTLFTLDIEGNLKGTQSAYIYGNIRDNKNGTLSSDKKDDTYCLKIRDGRTSLDWEPFVNTPFFPSYANIETAKEAYKSTLSNVGANLPMTDETDKRIINETKNRSYTYIGSKSGIKGEIDNEADAGGYEIYPEELRPDNFDTDKDGLPDWWEELFNSNINSANGDYTDSNADIDNNGYTVLEEYLDFMATPHTFMKPNEQYNINLKDLFNGYTNTPVYSVESQTLKTTINNDETLTIISEQKGIFVLNIKVTDKEGATYNRQYRIAVTDNQITGISHEKAIDEKNIRNYSIYSINGTKIAECSNSASCNIYQLNLTAIKQGIYVLKATDNKGICKTFKIIKQ